MRDRIFERTNLLPFRAEWIILAVCFIAGSMRVLMTILITLYSLWFRNMF
jgi:hypothetical protein